MLFEIAITPDRGDLLSIRGVVREIASLIDIEFNDDFFFTSVDNEAGILDFDVDLQSDGVKSYSLGYFEVSSLADTSLLYNNMLIANNVMGSCPISPLVDLGNYIMYLTGQPLHCFDYDKISGQLTVRFAKDGESIEALDGKTYKLSSDIVVIADDKQVQAIAGIIGSSASAVDLTTTKVIVESANFDKVLISKASSKLGISTASSSRFERGVDFSLPERTIKLFFKYGSNLFVLNTVSLQTYRVCSDSHLIDYR